MCGTRATSNSGPRSADPPCRALTAHEWKNINAEVRINGIDVILDALLLRLYTEFACRCGGALALRLVDLDTTNGLVRLTEKGATVRWQPITLNLAEHLRVARDRDPGVTVEQIAKDFGVHPMTLFKWLRQADVDAGTRPGVSGSDSAELREARKRIKLLRQENEVPHRAAAYLSQAHLPGNGSARS
ncbi:hypothetical protein GCM10027186_53600 [Micromonospora schwarzwaldensis]